MSATDAFFEKNSYDYLDESERGINEELIRRISSDKNEPEWMLSIRLSGLAYFQKTQNPTWGPDLSDLDLDTICYYARPGASRNAETWDEVPQEVRDTFEKLGIPEAERTALAGAGAQYESEMVYHSLKKEWEDKGVIFLDMDEALHKYPDLVKEHFMKCVPVTDHRFAALHAAVWSGGTFLYIPKGTHVNEPLQAYFRMNAPGMGQFEHTLIIVEEDSTASYIEGCSAPKYDRNALHAGCVEIYVKEGSQFRYSSAENWSKDTYNLNTKRAWVDAKARIEWVGANLGSGVTMLYPCSVLRGEGASADHLGVAFANDGQNQDTGAKVLHGASHTTSKIISKSISKGSGINTYRGLIQIAPHASHCTVQSDCDGLVLDPDSRSVAVPVIDTGNETCFVSHEASVGKLSPDDLFYLMSRGISEEHATSMIVNGFLDPIVRELPLEYAAEMNKLIEMEMEGVI